MYMIIQGTTPTHIFDLGFDSKICKEARFVYSQDGEVVIIKENNDVKLDGSEVRTTLTQEETYKFEPDVQVILVLRVLTNNNSALASEPVKMKCRAMADKEVLV